MYNVLSRGHWNYATFDVRKAPICCQGLAETSSSSLEVSLHLLLSFWPLGLFSPLLHDLGYQERMYPTPHPHVCFDGAAARDGVWIPSRRIHQTSKLPQSAGMQWTITAPSKTLQSIWAGGSVLSLLFGCRHFKRSDLALEIHRFPNSDSAGGKDWTSWLKNSLITPSRLCNRRRTIGQTGSNWFGDLELRSFSLALKFRFCDCYWREEDYSSSAGLWIDLERSLITSLT